LLANAVVLSASAMEVEDDLRTLLLRLMDEGEPRTA
jgi:hypothetical protein